jgi:Domain of unknown function (DUF4342)
MFCSLKRRARDRHPVSTEVELVSTGDLDPHCQPAAVWQQEHTMTDKTYWDTFKGESGSVLNKVRMLIHEGNVRRVVVKHDGRTVAEFPLTAGLVGAVLAPVLAAIGALVALLQDCTIEVERERQEGNREEQPNASARS